VILSISSGGWRIIFVWIEVDTKVFREMVVEDGTKRENGDYRVLSPYCVLMYSSIVVSEGTIVKDCQGIGRIG
jgi:hypothetical protein